MSVTLSMDARYVAASAVREEMQRLRRFAVHLGKPLPSGCHPHLRALRDTARELLGDSDPLPTQAEILAWADEVLAEAEAEATV